MGLTYRTVLIGIVVLGIAMGVSFGAGAAYGRGDKPEAAAAGLTSQQITQLYGPPTGGGAAAALGGASGPGGGAAAAGGANAAAGGGAAALLGGASVGRITAVSGNVVTIQTAQGASVKLNMGGSTSVSRVTSGASSDLKEGTVVVARGTRKDDGSIDITSISQVPPELQTLAGAGAAPTTPSR